MSETPLEAMEGAKFARFRALCASVDLDLHELRAGTLSRMELLAELTETVSDCERAADQARAIFEYYALEKPALRFNEVEQRTVIIGSLFSDIGKTGPVRADAAAQRVIAEAFGVENVPTPEMSLADFVTRYFPADTARRLTVLAELGLDPGMRMRAFWNRHSVWTLELIDHDGVPAEAVAAAATHHLLENVNPGGVVDAHGRFTRYFGENEYFDRPEKLVILLDKYDASRRRAQKSHAEAIAWLRKLVGKHPRFGCDAELFTLIDDLDVVLADWPAY